MNNRIGILGCGWLGLPMAKAFIKEGFEVSGTTTSLEKMAELQSQGIKPHQIRLTEKAIEGPINDFLGTIDTIIVNIPPNLRKNPEGDFYKKMQLLNSALEKSEVSHVIFVSSTSVYGKQAGTITEDTKPSPATESGRQLLASESLFQKGGKKTTIVRFGGLIGADRHPVKYLSGKKGLKNGEELVNLIHLDDCIHILRTIVKNDYWGEVFNGVYPFHPSKKEYYTREAIMRKVLPPNYSNTKGKALQKMIKSRNFLVKKHLLLTSIST